MKKIFAWLPLCVLLPAFYSNAGGVSLGATRVIYPADASQASLSIRNSSKDEAYLIQSWISNPDGSKSKDFIITPPLFVLKPEKENTLRLEMVGKPAWPADREVVYYLNSKAIPSMSASSKDSNIASLQIATQTVIKMFIRPEGLPSTPDAAPTSLVCHYNGNSVTIDNPSPYYVSLTSLKSGAEEIHGEMIAPKSGSTVKFKNNISSLSYYFVNDYGAISPATKCKS